VASRIDLAIGVIDGLNKDFTLTRGFIADTVVVMLNGQLRSIDQTDGWTIVGPVIRLNEAPRVGDVVQVYYRESIPTTVPGTGGTGTGGGSTPPGC
jgi:hypothetical protein